MKWFIVFVLLHPFSIVGGEPIDGDTGYDTARDCYRAAAAHQLPKGEVAGCIAVDMTATANAWNELAPLPP